MLSLLGVFLLLFQPTYSLDTLGGWPQAWAACSWAGPPKGQGGPPAGSCPRLAPWLPWGLWWTLGVATREGLWKESHGVHTEIGGRAELVLIHLACQSFESTERLPPLTVTHMGKPGVGSA